MKQPVNKTGYSVFSKYKHDPYIDIKHFGNYIVYKLKAGKWELLDNTDYVDLTNKNITDPRHYVAFKTYLL